MVDVAVTKEGDEVLLATACGMAIRFKQSNARPMGRNAAGVKGIRLGKGDNVVGMVVADPEATLLTVCANGFGKRTPFGPNSVAGPDESPEGLPEAADLDAEQAADDLRRARGNRTAGGERRGGRGTSSQHCYRTQAPRRQGMRDIKTTQRNGPVIGIVRVNDDDDVLMISARGKIQRISVGDINIIGRNTQGVRIMSLEENDRLVAVKRVPREEGNGTAHEEPEPEQEATAQDPAVLTKDEG